MSAFVLDCSVAISWILKDEADEEADSLLDLLEEEDAVVPSLWRLELGNVLVKAEKRGRLTIADSESAFAFADTLPIVTDDETEFRAFREIQALARSEELTTYDAAYLELAIRRGLPLATRDKALKAAAARRGVATLP